MGIFNHLFGGGHHSDPSKAAMPYLDKAERDVNEGYAPYIERGEKAYGYLQPHYEELMNNPQMFLNKLQESYQPSSEYEYKKDRLSKELGNTAAAGGVAGTPYHQEEQGRLVDSLLSQDMQQFLDNLFGLHSRGLEGEQNFYNQGFQSSLDRASDLSNIHGTEGTLAYKGAEQKSNNNNNKMQLLAQLLGSIGGGALGEAPGAAIGNKIGSVFGGWGGV